MSLDKVGYFLPGFFQEIIAGHLFSSVRFSLAPCIPCPLAWQSKDESVIKSNQAMRKAHVGLCGHVSSSYADGRDLMRTEIDKISDPNCVHKRMVKCSIHNFHSVLKWCCEHQRGGRLEG